MKLFGKYKKEVQDEEQDKTSETSEPSEFDKAKEEYQEIYEGCEKDTFSVKINYDSGATSILRNVELAVLLWILTCFKEKYGTATYWSPKHDSDLSMNFSHVSFITINKENKEDQDN